MVDFTENFNQYSTSKLPTFRDKFNNSTQILADLQWVSADTSKNRVNIGTEVLDLNIIRDNTNDSIVHDLGSTISDSNWVLRFKLAIDTLNLTALQTQGFFGLFSGDQTAGEETQQNAIGVVLTALTGTLTYRLFSIENDFINQGSSTIFTHALAVETVYVEIKRNSETTYEVNLYSDAKFTTLIESQQGISTRGTIDLRYIGMKNNASMTVGSSILGSMDDVEFWGGGKIIFQDDFATSANWVQTGTGVSITGGVISGWGADGTDRRLTHDLGKPLSDDNWKVEFDYQFTASNVPAHAPLIISDINQDIDAGTFDNDFIGVVHGTTVNELKIVAGDFDDLGGGGIGSTGIPIVTSTPYFPRLERLSATETRLSVFSDSARTTQIAGSPVTLTIPSTIDALQFIHSQNLSGGGVGRTLTGTLDNLVVSEEQIGIQEGTVTFEDNFTQKPVTFTDDFSTPANFTTFGTDVAIAGGVLSATDDSDGTNHTAIHVLPTPLSDTNWVMRFKITPTVLTAITSPPFESVIHIGAFDADHLVGTVTPQDMIAFTLREGVGGSFWDLRDTDGAPPNITAPDTSSIDTPMVGVPRFVELSRTSATTYQAKLYLDPAYTDVIDTITGTCSPTTDVMPFVGVKTNMNVDATAVASCDIDDLQVWNGTSTITDWISNDDTRLHINTTNGVLKVQPDFTTLNRTSMVHDLGVGNVDDNNWTLRLKANVLAPVTQGASANNVNIYFGLADTDETFADNTAGQNAIALRATLDVGSNTYTGISADNQNLNGAGADFVFATGISVETIFWELKRTSLTTYEAIRFSDAEYTQVVERLSGTCEAGIIGLRYIKFWQSSLGSTDHRQQVEFDDIEFYNGVSVARTPVEEVKDFEDDFFADNWADAGTQNQVNTSTRVLDFDFDRVITTIHKTVFDLGVGNVSDSKWTLRWKQTNDNVVGNAGIGTLGYIGIMDSDQNFSPFGAQDFIGIECFINNISNACRLKDVTGQSLAFSSGVYTFTDPIAVNIRYWEIKRLSPTTVIANIFSDSDYSNLIETSGVKTISVNVVGLRYIAVANNNQATSLSSHDGTIDDVQFWNGQSALDHENKWRKIDI